MKGGNFTFQRIVEIFNDVQAAQRNYPRGYQAGDTQSRMVLSQPQPFDRRSLEKTMEYRTSYIKTCYSMTEP